VVNRLPQDTVSRDSQQNKLASSFKLIIGQIKPMRTGNDNNDTWTLSISDATGSIPIQMTEFDRDLMDGFVCLMEWNALPYTCRRSPNLPGATTPTKAGDDDTDFPKVYLEIISKPWVLHSRHFLMTVPFYSFTSTDFDAIKIYRDSLEDNDPFEEANTYRLIEQFKPLSLLLLGKF
jgi:hypothetical protein